MDLAQPGALQELMKVAETKVTVSLAVSLYFKPPAETFQEGLLMGYEEFLKLCEPKLTWFADETGKKYREATAEVLRIPFRRVPEAVGAGRFYSWGAFASVDHRDASPCQFYGMVPGVDGPPKLGHLRAALPVEAFAKDPQGFVTLAKTLSARVPLLHGTAGFSFSESMLIGRRQANEALLVAAAMRFSGVEVEGQGKSAQCCQDAIKGPNWLTLIASSFVERLGGMEALRKQLSEAITLHPMPWGVMIQAGPAPGVGDVNEGERLPLYREVNKVLRPVRVGRHWNLGVEFEEERTRRWIERFDE